MQKLQVYRDPKDGPAYREFYEKSEVDKVIAELKENHRKEVAQLQMKISGLEKLVEIANKVIKQKGDFTIKDIKFGGVNLEGIKCTTQSRK